MAILSAVIVSSKLFSTEVGEDKVWVRPRRRSEEGFLPLTSAAVSYCFSWHYLGSVLRVSTT